MKRKIKKALHNRRQKRKTVQHENVPRITNDTVAEHREQVIENARKYIYPLKHSKHRIVLVSVGVLILAITSFLAYCTIALYKFQSNTTFLYKVSQVLPFPIARIDNQFVAYENYLFELRHYTHYYENQLQVDFTNDEAKAQLDQFKNRALQEIINEAYVKRLAKEHNVSVSEAEVNEEIELARAQNRLGSEQQVLEDVIQDYWGWSIDDFKRTLRQEILNRKVVQKLDTETKERASAALAELQGGADFAAVAQKYSDDDITKANGGEYGFAIDRASREVPPRAIDALYSLEKGAYSEVIDTGYSLEIVKVIDINGTKLRAAHISFMYKPIETYINDLKDATPARVYITLPEVPEQFIDENNQNL